MNRSSKTRRSRTSSISDKSMELGRLMVLMTSLLAVGCDNGNGKGSSPSQDGTVPFDVTVFPDGGGTHLVSTVEHHGVTWTFSEPVQVGRFITGDYYVVGPATVTAVSPSPTPQNGRHGSVLNLPPTQDESGFDDRVVSGRYEPSLRAYPPIALVPGDSLLSSVSVDEVGQVDNWLREGNGEQSESPVWSISVLTCMDTEPPADAFRPSYADTSNRLYTASDLDLDMLPSLQPPLAVENDYLEMFAQRLIRPWVDACFYEFDAQVEYMAMYGREYARVSGMASLLIMLDLPEAQREIQQRILIGMVQRGIDLWGLVRAGYPGWYAHGGHGSGRKWPIIFAGLLLQDPEMASPSVTHPEVMFGEDMHTSFAADLPYGLAWCGADVVYTGHMGVWQGETVSDEPGWGPYEHLPPNEWVSDIGEGYRRCCTSLAWVGQALAARLMGAESDWAHDAFFAYVDRWMDPEGDAEYTEEIFQLTGWDFRASWAAHGQAWDPIVNAMWEAYR